MAGQDTSGATGWLMTFLAAVALLAFLAAATQLDAGAGRWPVIAHLVLALGAMPLVCGAMIYFTPVLTRTRAPPRSLLVLPLLALTAGLAAAAGMLGWSALLLPAAMLALVAVAGLWLWMRARERAMLGEPHPCLRWYRWALVCLGLGLAAIATGLAWPEQWVALRRFHVHVNTLGFVGLAAMGTLRVLLPTVGGYRDPQSRIRLARDLGPLLAGTLLIAAGAAWFPRIAWIGLVPWALVLARFIAPLFTTWRRAVWGWHSAGTALAVAVLGLALVLAAGGVHAIGLSAAHPAVVLFVLVFLFPLVTGAVSFLLPVWIWPRHERPEYAAVAARLGRASALRALVLLVAGLLVAAGVDQAGYLTAAVVVAFLVQIIHGVRGG